MNKNMILLLVFVFIYVIFSCTYDYNNPLDEESSNYQGWPLFGEDESPEAWSIASASPENDAEEEDYTPLIDWDDFDDIATYEIDWALADASGLDGTAEASFSISEYQLPEIAFGQPVYWRIRCTSTNAYITPWSETYSFSIKTPEFGDVVKGGIVFYLDGNGGGLVAAESDQGAAIEWGGYGTLVSTGNAVGTGVTNTIAIVSELGVAEPYKGLTNYAAKLCSDLSLNGYDDWFLPSKGELDLMYTNLHLQGYGNFSLDEYLSSSEADSEPSNRCWRLRFTEGHSGEALKSAEMRVRAVRAF